MVDEQDQRTLTVLPLYVPAQDVVHALAGAGAVAHAPWGQAGAAKYRGPDLGIKVKRRTYTVAAKDTLKPLAQDDDGMSYTEARQKQQAFIDDDPEAGRQTQVVDRHEAVLA